MNKVEGLMPDELYQMPENCDFSKIFNGDTHSNECTPKLDNKFLSKFSGLLINGPEQVVWPKDVDPNDYPTGPWGDIRRTAEAHGRGTRSCSIQNARFKRRGC